LFYIIQGTSNCGSNNGGCEQLCFHKVPTGTSCGCQLGMKLTSDNKSCEDAFEAGKKVLFRCCNNDDPPEKISGKHFQIMFS
jgi:hypothetical protein